jgi:predicted RNA-binding Zn-ribbon protein involved in translation (DUF1610 family)
LLLDIETFPMLFFAWKSYEANALKVVENTSVASFSAKWLGGKQVTRCIADYKGYKKGGRDDRALLADLWKLLDEAELVVAHNGQRFDAKKVTARFIALGFGPPSPYTVVDTLLEVRKVAGYDSHRLNELCREWGIGEKVRTGGADLWFDCLAGDEKAWRKMKRYNACDVAPLLEGAYLRLRPWMKTHPNVAGRPMACPKCGSGELQARGTARNRTTEYQRFQCQACGGWSRDSVNLQKEKLLVSA